MSGDSIRVSFSSDVESVNTLVLLLLVADSSMTVWVTMGKAPVSKRRLPRSAKSAEGAVIAGSSNFWEVFSGMDRPWTYFVTVIVFRGAAADALVVDVFVDVGFKFAVVDRFVVVVFGLAACDDAMRYFSNSYAYYVDVSNLVSMSRKC